MLAILSVFSKSRRSLSNSRREVNSKKRAASRPLSASSVMSAHRLLKKTSYLCAMENTGYKTAHYLLQSKAIKLEPATPFTWASGWKSPIYCDNRISLSYPAARTYIRNSFVELIRREYPSVEVIAGVATGAIAQGALVAQEMELPFVYVRSAPKDHGRENLIEGELAPGKKVVVIEDLISTGSSSLKAVQALRDAGSDVLGMCAIFTYGFQTAADQFRNMNCALFTLSSYELLIEEAINTGYIRSEQMDLLKRWRTDPANWKP
jgi:orotate phosphoribosyltransferase